MNGPSPGLHLVHKPIGSTSFEVVRRFHAEAVAAGQPKLSLCHTGTLDPFAEGLLLVLAGQATRLIDLFHAIPKIYEAEVTWGAETDNGDPGGKTISTGDASFLSSELLDEAIAPFVGWNDQVPPATSAKKIGGEPAYRKVHRGETVVLPACRVFLHEATWIGHDLPRTSRLRIRCGRGYYVRSLARELGRNLGCGAHLSALERTSVGPWSDPGAGRIDVVTGVEIAPWLEVRSLDKGESRAISQGKPIDAGEIRPGAWRVPEGFPEPAGPIVALHEGKLVALLRRSDGRLHTFANLRGGL